MELPISTIVNVSVSEAQTGAGQYNTSNIGLFTREAYQNSFGDLGYKIYLGPQEVAVDWGTDSETYKMSVKIFSQQPNILAGGGYLVIIPFEDTAPVVAQQTITLSAVPASGDYKLHYLSDVTAVIADGVDAAALQVLIRTLSGLEAATVTGSEAAGFVVTMTGVTGPAALMTVSDNSLQTAAPVNVSVTVATTRAGTTTSTETLAEAVTRTVDLVQYFGILAAEITGQVDMLAAADVVQALNKIAFFVSRNSSSVNEGGQLDLLRSGGYTQSRGLYYGGADDSSALGMSAAYAGRMLCVNFSGNKTTLTANLKVLRTVQPDPSMDATLYNLCKIAGADIYASIQGNPAVISFGANKFFDQVYNLRWFVGAIQIAGFNYLYQTSTKIPQTESGMDGLRGAWIGVCEQGVFNQYVAPGQWNSPDTFGNLQLFLENVAQQGYYIYTQPIAQQSQADREDRIAPLGQIAIKEAGAFQSSDVIIYVNA